VIESTSGHSALATWFSTVGWVELTKSNLLVVSVVSFTKRIWGVEFFNPTYYNLHELVERP